MAKCRFPGRALKLKNRKRIKFRYDDRKDNTEENYSRQIARGFEAFRIFFGESDEEDELFFEGFTSEDVEKAIELKKVLETEVTSRNQDENLSDESSAEEEEKIVSYSRSSRKIRQPQRFIDSPSLSPDDDNKRRNVGRPRKGPSLSGLGFPSSTIPSESIIEGNKVYKNISLYADTISTQPVVEPTRVTRNKVPAADSSNLSPASNKLQEKIEKLLQTQWDGRSKTSPAQKDEDTEERGRNTATPENLSSKNVLRKAKLQLNKKVLQKIRNPVSAQLLSHSTEDSSAINCAVCFMRTKCEFHYGASMCHQCCSFLSSFSGAPPLEEMACLRGFGGCQIVGISVEERCQPCWLSNALQACTLPSLMHDKFRKKLPHYLKEKVPTSLARSVSDNSDQSRLNNSQSSSGLLGSVVDLPGGWKRNIAGPEVVVISPSGQKFKSIAKLEEYLLKLGVKADARIFFGGNTTEQPVIENELMTMSNKGKAKSMNKRIPFKDSNFVVTSLPGGWIRKTKIRESKNTKTLDVFVTSPDGQTFRSKRELSAYFQSIGKADDVLKYFPLFHEYEERKTPSDESDSNTEMPSDDEVQNYDDGVLSSEERASLNQNISDLDDGVLSDCDIDNNVALDRSQPSLSNLFNSSFASEDASHEDFVGFDRIVTPVHSSSPSVGKSKKNNSISFTIEVPSLQHLKSAEVNAYETNNTTTTTTHSEFSGSELGTNSDMFKKKKKKHKEKKKKKKKSKEYKESRKLEKEKGVLPDELSYKSSCNDSMIKNIPKESEKSISNNSERIPDRVPPLPNDLNKDDPISPATPVAKMVQTQKFDCGWTRKIKWNEEGIGKVTFVVTPSGSTIHSVSELQGYLKKEGESTKSASYYFAQNLRREDVPLPKVTPKAQRKKKKLPPVKNDVLFKENIPNVETKISKSEVGDTGPRIKRVCRSFEQALGMPRATFPNTEESDDKEQPAAEPVTRKDESEPEEPNSANITATIDKNTFKKPLQNQKTPTTKVVRRVLWCNRCSGCLTPNCRKCIFCMDMVKYGGPGTKKKPCQMRKCLNPSRLVSDKKKDSSSSSKKESLEKKSLVTSGNSKQLLKRTHAGKKPRNVLRDVNSNAPEEENCQGVFVPGQLKRNGDGVAKDSSQMKSLSADSQMINPNFWEAFESSNVVFNGFPVVQSAPLHLTCLCFRCGAGGEEEMLYCSYCCEGVHVFCLEEGEGPLSSKEVPQWVCRRCAVCHVCGTSTYGGRKIEDLTRCSSCHHYYHLECLGPEAHKNCSNPTGALWELEVKKLVHSSIPRAPPIYSVKSESVKQCTEVAPSVNVSSLEDVIPTMYCYRHPNILDSSPFKLQELPHFKQLMRASKDVAEPDITLFTDMDSSITPLNSLEKDPMCYVMGQKTSTLNRSHSNLEAEDMAAVTCVTDNILDLDFAEMDGLDLDALMDDLDNEDENMNIVDQDIQEEDIIDLYLDVDLTSDKKKDREVSSMAEDEYLSLGYKMITEYEVEKKRELSLYRLTQMAQVELFTALQYPHISTLHKKFAVRPRHRGSNLISHAKVIAPIRDDSDTDTASDGELEESDDESEVKKKKKTPKEVLESMELRRIQYNRDLKNKLEEKKLRREEANVVENEKLERLKETIRREKIRRQPIKWIRKVKKEVSLKQEAPKRKRSPIRCPKPSRDDLDSSYTEDTPPPKKLKKRKSLLRGSNGEENKKKRKLSFEDDQQRKDKQHRLLDNTINSILQQLDEPKEKPQEESFIQSTDEAPKFWIPKSYEQLDAFFAARDPEYMSRIHGHKNQLDDDSLFEAAITDLEKTMFTETPPVNKEESNKKIKIECSVDLSSSEKTKKDDSKAKENWPTLNKLKDTLIRRSKAGLKDRNESHNDIKSSVKLKRRSDRKSKPLKSNEEDCEKLTNGNNDSENSCNTIEDSTPVRKSRRSLGRASELASLRKAKFDM